MKLREEKDSSRDGRWRTFANSEQEETHCLLISGLSVRVRRGSPTIYGIWTSSKSHILLLTDSVSGAISRSQLPTLVHICSLRICIFHADGPHLLPSHVAGASRTARTEFTPSPHRIRTSFASTPPALCMHVSSSKSDLRLGIVQAHASLGADCGTSTFVCLSVRKTSTPDHAVVWSRWV